MCCVRVQLLYDPNAWKSLELVALVSPWNGPTTGWVKMVVAMLSNQEEESLSNVCASR